MSAIGGKADRTIALRNVPLMTQSGEIDLQKLSEKIWRSTLCRIDTIGRQPRLLDRNRIGRRKSVL